MNRVVIITGAESGIGRACAEAFGALGDTVAVGYLQDLGEAERTVKAAEAAGGRAVPVRCSVDNEGDVERAFKQVARDLGRPSILVNSAGINMNGTFVRDMSLSQWQKLIATDLTGAFLTSRRFLAVRDREAPACIVHISSIHAFANRAGGADYCAAKGGLSRLVETLALEEATGQVRVNAVEPGMILTAMNQKALVDPAFLACAEHNIPLGRAGRPEEVAALVRWLCSPEASYITGTRVKIDGGLALLQALGA